MYIQAYKSINNTKLTLLFVCNKLLCLIESHPARAKVMFKKNLHKNGVQGVYREPMVVSKQA